ncbi:MAG: Sec-independent protein translocase protein TatB [Gammaproteobacteria bacterium]|nr:Sec-independent protein translocase protein TatB [Gammaproteobacteria bacterium]
MFDVGFAEVMLIGIVSLVVIGPERLPAVARTVGLWVGKMRRFVTGVKADFAKELESGDLQKLIGDQREQINELKGLVESARGDLKEASSKIVKDTSSSLDELKKDVDSAKQSVAQIGDSLENESSGSGSQDNPAMDGDTSNTKTGS